MLRSDAPVARCPAEYLPEPLIPYPSGCDLPDAAPAGGPAGQTTPERGSSPGGLLIVSTRPSIASGGSSVSSDASFVRDPLSAYSRLTPRDRLLLQLLDAHQVLLGDQIQRLLFSHRRTCQLRLDALRSFGFVDRFRFSGPRGGAESWRWVLGLAGARFQAGANGRPLPTARAHAEYLTRLGSNPALAHLLDTNEFFVRLRHTERTHPDQRPDRALVLQRWWPERHATERFPGIAPDGHGIWSYGDITVGFYLECDRGSESLTRLVSKLDAYRRQAATGGPSYPVLFWLPSREREENLTLRLRSHDVQVPVATAVHGDHPAGQVWHLHGFGPRLRLYDLPSDHGPDSANNPNWLDGELDLGDQHEARR